MPTYATPGVYVEEMPSGSMPLSAAGTAVAAFVGFTAKAPVDDREDLNTPRSVTSWSQYERLYGGVTDDTLLPLAVKGFFENGGGKCYIVRIPNREQVRGALPPTGANEEDVLEFASISTDKEVTVQIEPIAPPEPTNGASDVVKDPKFTVTITADGADEEVYSGLSFGARGPNPVTTINEESQLVEVLQLRDIVPAQDKSNLAVEAKTIKLAVPAKIDPTADNFEGKVNDRNGVAGLSIATDVTMVAVPDLWTVARTNKDKMDDYGDDKYDVDMWKAVHTAVKTHCETHRCMAILDAPPGLDVQQMTDWREQAGLDSKFATLYYPWLKVGTPPGQNGKTTTFVPPSAHMAGIWSRTDNTRGVWKAPANESVLGVLDVQREMTDKEQEDLNPEGINAIRSFGSRGLRVWGARTLSSDPSWRYINVRRLFNMIETSIKDGTNWVVFEPNDRALWDRVARTINAFLLGLWRDGALFGATPDEAFFVRCDEETNPPDSIDQGKLIVEVGVAPVKPAEFIIFRLQQKAIGSAE